LRSRLRLVDTSDDVDFSVFIEYANTEVRYNVRFGTTADGDPIVRVGDGEELVLDDLDDGYHLYELIFDPDAGTDGEATLYVNGEARADGYTGTESTLRRVIWGSGRSPRTGEGRYALVEWMTLTCGDGIVDPDEACDDGNLKDGDGCSRVCTLED
jgi:cysteine-rich repeat protein